VNRKGDALGEWVLDELLGEGAFGQVWRARAQSDPSRKAAVKVPRDDRGAAVLRSEGAIQSKLSGPSFPRVLGVSTDPAYVAFELIDGESLRELLRAKGRLEPAAAGAIARSILEALAEAHAAGVVHRDLKPENVLVAADGRLLVTDFGLAVHLPQEMAQSLGEDEAAPVAGSVPYLAPEVREGQGSDARGDLYAFGVVLFELLTGTLPGAADLPSGAGVPKAWDEVYRRACARREKRFASAAEALVELGKAIAASPQAKAKEKAKPRVDVKALLERVAREESDFLAREFMAYVTPEGRATARVKSKTYTFKVKKGVPGLALLKAMSPTEAVIVKVFPALPR
jgi:serine/threonine-protein kinase